MLFHDDAHTAVLDLGSNEQEDHREKAMVEILAENVRLLYVALTRAKNRCYVAWGKVKGAEGSAMVHLMKGMDATDLRRGLEEFLGAGSGHARVLDIPQGRPELPVRPALTPEEPAARVFEGTIDRTWGMASYTAFIHGLHKGSEAADRDTLWQGQRDGAEEKGERPKDIFSFPKGARAGTLLHEVFEKIDFTAGDEAIRAMVEDTLADHGFDPTWTDVVTDMVRKVLDVDLGGVTLSGLGNSDRLTELEFMFPIKPLTPGILEQALADCMPSMKILSPLVGEGQGEGEQIFTLSQPPPSRGRSVSGVPSPLEGEGEGQGEGVQPIAPVLYPAGDKTILNSESLRATGGSVAIPVDSCKNEIATVVSLPRNDSTQQSHAGRGEGQGEGEKFPFPFISPRLSFDPVKGFLRGFMDLVFQHEGRYYLIDWKSNHLGNSVDDYSHDALLKSMIRDSYILQYHLYTVALHQYLKNRLEGYSYDKHFGGIFYVYLRGVDPAMGPEYGIFHARPDEENLVNLSEVLIDCKRGLY